MTGARALLSVLAPLAATVVGLALPLPSTPAAGAGLQQDSQWWTRVGDRVYYAPPAASGLSRRVEDYYYARGYEAALPQDLKERRVGGQGRLHIFHLPEGPSMLQMGQQAGSRRSSISDLTQLAHGMTVSNSFPPYSKEPGYVNPLNATGRELEKSVVGLVTSSTVQDYEEKITSFPSRSWRDSQKSADVQGFLQKQFEGMGFTTCLHTFRSGGPSTNVVAFIPGQTAGTVTLGAHYDSIPASGPAPGAEDNGSGVAGLLTIANALFKAGVKPLKSIYLVGFAGEEPGLLGSAAFAGDLARGGLPEKCTPAQQAKADDTLGFLRRASSAKSQHQAIVMDEIGWLSPKLSKPTVNLESYDWSKDLMDHLVQSSSDYNGDAMDVVHSNNPFGSDHMSFLQRSIPAVLTINGDDEAYPGYHKPTDTIEKVTFSYVTMIAKMNAAGLLRAAGVDA